METARENMPEVYEQQQYNEQSDEEIDQQSDDQNNRNYYEKPEVEYVEEYIEGPKEYIEQPKEEYGEEPEIEYVEKPKTKIKTKAPEIEYPEESKIKYVEKPKIEYVAEPKVPEIAKSLKSVSGFFGRNLGAIAKSLEKKRQVTGYDYKRHTKAIEKCSYNSLFTSTEELEKLKGNINVIVKQKTDSFIFQLENMIKNIKQFKNIDFGGYIASEIGKLTDKHKKLVEEKNESIVLGNRVRVIYRTNSENMNGFITHIKFTKIPVFTIHLDEKIIEVPASMLCVDNKQIDFEYVEKYNTGQTGGNIKHSFVGGKSNSGSIRSKNDNLSDTSNTSIVDKTAEIQTTTGSNSSNFNYCE